METHFQGGPLRKLFSKRNLVVVCLILLALFVVRPQAARLRWRISQSISAELGRKVEIGSVHLRFLPRPGFELEDLVIHKQYQAHGYGSKLLNHAIEFARQKNFLRITLLTDRPENQAQEFFRKHGFHESSMIPMRLLVTPEQDQSQSNL